MKSSSGDVEQAWAATARGAVGVNHNSCIRLESILMSYTRQIFIYLKSTSYNYNSSMRNFIFHIEKFCGNAALNFLQCG
jgi:hypothetical protein